MLTIAIFFQAHMAKAEAFKCEDYFTQLPQIEVQVPESRLRAQEVHQNQERPTTLKSRIVKAFKSWLRKPLEWISGYTYLLKKSNEARLINPGKSHLYFRDFLSTMDIDYNVQRLPGAKIAKTGPLVMVSNHPFGLVESLALVDYIIQQRDDLKIIVNQALLDVVPEELHRHFITVNISDGASKEEKQKANLKAMREANGHLSQGGSLLLYPYGKASLRSNNPVHNYAIDSFWKVGFLSMVGKSDAQIVNFFVPGENSDVFYKYGDLGNGLGRMVLFLREIIWRSGQTLHIVQGTSYSNKDVREFFGLNQSRSNEAKVALMAYLKLRTYLLAKDNQAEGSFATPDLGSYFTPGIYNLGPRVFAEDLQQLVDANLEDLHSPDEIREFLGEEIYYLYDQYRRFHSGSLMPENL